jgi:dolichol-phosphate mannosyltransferase
MTAQRRSPGSATRGNIPLALLLAVQAASGASVAARLLRTARGKRIEVAEEHAAPVNMRMPVSVLVPVLNEHARLAPCLEGLIAQGGAVSEILVIDGGSTDGTQDLVLDYASRDSRIQLLDASPVPAGWNGKAWGLHIGFAHADPRNAWILTVDADVRPEPALAPSLVAHAQRERLDALSVATQQEVSGPAEALLHPAMLTTLVYRLGIPGSVYSKPASVQANGQCFLIRRAPLDAVGGFAAVRDSLCEDVTLARALVGDGYRVGFSEAGELVRVRMYEGARDAWRNWTRSLPLRDRHSGAAGWLGLIEVTLAQALPLLVVALLTLARRRSPLNRALLTLNGTLLAMRLGVLVGTARAYRQRPWTYWLSPLADLPVAVALWRSALRRRHVWRGREIVRGGQAQTIDSASATRVQAREAAEPAVRIAARSMTPRTPQRRGGMR